MTNYQKDIFFSIIIICLAMVTGFVAFSYSFESSYFPRILSVFLAAIATLLLLRNFFQDKKISDVNKNKNDIEKPDKDMSPLVAAAFVFGSIITYVLAITLVNYEISTIVFITVITWIFGYRKPIANLAISIGLTASLYGVFFEFLAVARPDSIFFY